MKNNNTIGSKPDTVPINSVKPKNKRKPGRLKGKIFDDNYFDKADAEIERLFYGTNSNNEKG